MKTTFFAALLMGVGFASGATISFDFNSPANSNLGSYTYTFSSSGTSITAYGYEDGKSNNLYIKKDGGDETGLGLAGQDDFEIDNEGLVILDISKLSTTTGLQLEIASLTEGEHFAIYGLSSSAFNGGTTAPSIQGNALVSGGSSLDTEFFSVPNAASYPYLAVTATSGNILLEGLSANFSANVGPLSATPEPASFAVVGMALVGVALAGRKRRG